MFCCGVLGSVCVGEPKQATGPKPEPIAVHRQLAGRAAQPVVAGDRTEKANGGHEPQPKLPNLCRQTIIARTQKRTQIRQ